jgi:RNA polymerase-binding transcription factor DksA
MNTDSYKARLEEEKENLEKNLGTIAQPNASVPGEWEAVQKDTSQEADPNDRADLLDQYQENRALVDVLNPRYKEVVAALARIEDGSYGKCDVCGNEIEADRLDADPAAKTCISHKDS